MKSAAMLVIGDEILSGKFQEENAAYVIRRFRETGIRLSYVAVIPDVIEVIADAVRGASAKYDIVITSGGIGPTHDDMTFEAIAVAFGVPLIEQKALKDAIVEFGWELTEAVLRMTRVPEGTHLRWMEGIRYPIMQMQNVVILPGVPSIFQMKLERLIPEWAGTPLVSDRVFVDEPEALMAERLGRIAADYTSVDIGSYPRFGEKEYKVIVTLEGASSQAVLKAKAAIESCMKTVKIGKE